MGQVRSVSKHFRPQGSWCPRDENLISRLYLAHGSQSVVSSRGFHVTYGFSNPCCKGTSFCGLKNAFPKQGVWQSVLDIFFRKPGKSWISPPPRFAQCSARFSPIIESFHFGIFSFAFLLLLAYLFFVVFFHIFFVPNKKPLFCLFEGSLKKILFVFYTKYTPFSQDTQVFATKILIFFTKYVIFFCKRYKVCFLTIYNFFPWAGPEWTQVDSNPTPSGEHSNGAQRDPMNSPPGEEGGITQTPSLGQQSCHPLSLHP